MNVYQDIEKILSNTEYAVLHGWESLPDHHNSDLDIAINPQHLNVLEESLVDYKSGKLVQMLQHESSCFYFIVAIRNGNGMEYLQVDAATDYRRNGLTYFTSEKLNSRRQKWKGFWVAESEIELAYLLVKKILKGTTPEAQKRRLGYLTRKLRGQYSTDISTELFGKELGPQVISWISDDAWGVLESNIPKLKRALILETVRKDPLNPLKYWIKEVKRMLGRCLYPTGLFIAVLGPDGAGKSTLIDKLEQKLSGAFRNSVKFHLRPGIIGKKEEGNPVTDPHGNPPRSYLMSILKIGYYLTDYILGYLFKLYPKLVRSTMIVFDRYYDDILVDSARYRYGGPSILAELIHYFIPKPDLILTLDVSEEMILTRKQEVGKEELIRQRKSYRELAAKLPNAVILDSDQNPEKLADDASEIIIDYLHKRYMMRRNHYFSADHKKRPFDWLNHALSADPRKSCFAIRGSESKDKTSDWETYCEFNYLPVNEGRGYLLPINRKLAANGLMLYNAQSEKAKVGKALLMKPYISLFSSLLMKSVSVTTSRDLNIGKKSDLLIFEYLKNVTNWGNLDFALSLGTPGPHRKPVVQLNNREGVIVGYAKVGWNEVTNSLVKNEADTIKNLSHTSFDSFSMPSVLHADWWHGRYITILSSPEGKLLPAPSTLNIMYMNVINELADLRTQSMPIRKSAFWAELLNRVKKIKNSYYRGILERNGIPRIETSLSNLPLPFHMSHGDLAPWNAYIRDGKLFLYDWEYARQDAPPGWDLFHFIYQTNGYLKNSNPNELYEAIVCDDYKSMSKQYWEKLGIGEDARNILFLLYIIERLSFIASEEAENYQKLNQLSKIVFLMIHD